MSASRQEKLAALALVLAPLVYFFPAVIGRLVLCPADGVTFNFPLRVTVAAMLREGHLPLWNPYIFGGMPLFAAAQAGVLFPLNWLFLALPAGLAMNLAMLTAYALAGLGAFLFARRSGANLFGALITGFVWQFSGFLIAHIGHTNVVQVAALLPWLLWAIDGYGLTSQRRWAILTAALVAAQTFAGHPQTLVYSLLLAAAYAGCLAPRKVRLLSLVMLAAGLLLAAVQIIPTLELLRHSQRVDRSYDFFSSFSLPPLFLLTWFAPFIVGGGDGHLFRAPYFGERYYGEYIGYVGLLPLTLALLAPFVHSDRRTKFWSLVALLALVLALGRHLPFESYRLVQHLPGLNLFRVSARHLMEVDFALAVLAGRAVTFFPKIARPRVLLLVLVLFLATWLAVTLLRPAGFKLARAAPVTILRAPELFLPLCLAALSGWALFCFARRKRGAPIMLGTIVILDLALWGQFAGWRNGPQPADTLFQKSPALVDLLRPALQHQRILTFDQPGAGFTMETQPNFFMIHQIENLAGYDGFGLARQSRLAGEMVTWGAFPDPERTLSHNRALDLYGVRYLISLAAPDSVGGRWRPLARIGDIVVHENANTLPRAWLATEARAMEDAAKLKVISDEETWDPRRTVLLDGLSQLDLPAAAEPVGEVEITRHEPNMMEIATSSATTSILVLADNYYPGWRATVDEQPVKILRANYNLRAVVLPPGRHQVRFNYWPRSVQLGLCISILTSLTLALWWWRGTQSRA